MAASADEFENAPPETFPKPAENAEVVVPSDTVRLLKVSRALYVGGAGNISVQMSKNDKAVTFMNVPAGAILPIRITRVNSTSTTASNMLSLY